MIAIEETVARLSAAETTRITAVMAEARPVGGRSLAGPGLPHVEPAVARGRDHFASLVAIHVAHRPRSEQPAAGVLGPARRLGAVLPERVKHVAAAALDHLGGSVAVDVGDRRRREEGPALDRSREGRELLPGHGVPAAEQVVEVHT